MFSKFWKFISHALHSAAENIIIYSRVRCNLETTPHHLMLCIDTDLSLQIQKKKKISLKKCNREYMNMPTFAILTGWHSY